jgi:hypothetical protein
VRPRVVVRPTGAVVIEGVDFELRPELTILPRTQAPYARRAALHLRLLSLVLRRDPRSRDAVAVVVREQLVKALERERVAGIRSACAAVCTNCAEGGIVYRFVDDVDWYHDPCGEDCEASEIRCQLDDDGKLLGGVILRDCPNNTPDCVGVPVVEAEGTRCRSCTNPEGE